MLGFSIYLKILDIWLGFEYASGIKYTGVLNILQYSYNNIIIKVTNIAILELLSARICTSRCSATNHFISFNTR